ncbi:CLUMA_CG001651, isoform A [Clunio marinus]|uniref:CLUMA_CG001651, isoform A n=1 Tax=Clunio marinus TaxID=568069 RepID=A0A1J1HII6_9DIPT|nr:CLUMA_CG001651, isoform A [Clunio marinus]
MEALWLLRAIFPLLITVIEGETLDVIATFDSHHNNSHCMTFFTELQSEITDENRFDISICVNEILRKYLKPDYMKNSSTIFLNLLPNFETTSMMTQQRILKLLNEDETHQVNLIIKDDAPPQENEPKAREKAKNYLILVTFPTEIVENIKKLQKLSMWNHEAKFVVVVTERFSDQFEMEVVVSGTFKLFFDYSILNVYVLIQNLDVDNLLQSFIWYPYDGNSCSNILSYNNLETIDECEMFNHTSEGEKKFEMRELIPEQPSHLPDKFHQCPMIVTTPIWEPFVIGTSEAPTGGIEFLLIKTIAEKLDMKLIFRVVDDATAFRLVTEDEETGFYSDLIKRKIDVMIGGLYDNEISRKLLSTTIPYDSDEITWCVQRSGLAPNWMNVFAIFDIMLWIYAIICIFGCSLFLFISVKIENDRKENFLWALMIIMCYSIGIYGHYDPRRGFIRYYIAFLCFYGMHFSAAYHSFLLSVLTTPRYSHQTATIHEAIDAEYHFTGGENLKAVFERPDKASNHLKEAYKPCYEMDKCLMDIERDEKLAVAISRQHATNARIPLNVENMYCFDKANNIFSFSVVMLFKKDHHLLPAVNVLIRRITESGFILKWKADNEKVKINEIRKQRGDSHENAEPLNLGHVLGSFGLMFVGFCLAIGAFINEWIVYYLVHKRNNKFLQKYIEEKFLYS